MVNEKTTRSYFVAACRQIADSMMSTFGAVLDACVLIPAALCDLLLRTAAADLYRAHWSDDILEEVRRTLVGQGMATDEGAARRITAMRRAFPAAIVHDAAYRPLIGAMPNHPGDRHVLAAAVISGARIIVTSNLRHFPPDALSPFSVESQSPDEFLSELLSRDAEVVVRIVRQQTADLRSPPMTVSDVFDRLSQHAPGFVARARTLRHHLLP